MDSAINVLDQKLLDSLAHNGKDLDGDKELKDYSSLKRRDSVSKPVILVGMGTCGLGAGALAVKTAIINYLAENAIEAELIETGCIGLCSEEPLVDIQVPGKQRVSFGRVTADSVSSLIASVINDDIDEKTVVGVHRDEINKKWKDIKFLDEHPFFALQERIVLSNCGINNPLDLFEYVSRGGFKALSQAIHKKTSGEVCSIIEESGLRGRGGGGFKTGTKWKFALNSPMTKRYFICNADEGDPGAFMDRAVIEGDPYKLLEGLAISSYAIGSDTAYIYIRAEYPLAIERLEKSISSMKKAGLLGENILGSGFDLNIKIKKGAGAFVCGEETALIHSIEGKRGMPRPRPPFPAVSGLFGKPTIINNVETLANIPTIILKGADYFNSFGTERSSGTKVFAISGKVERTGLVEVATGTTIRDIIFKIAGGVANGKKYKAVQMGGPSGGCIPEQHLDTPVDYESLKEVGAMIGSGGMVVMDEDTCMVDLARFFMDFIQKESCGKCIPCREGTRRILEILESITKNRKTESKKDTLERFKGIMQMESLAEVIRDTSLCGLGQTAPNPVLSTIRWFKEEYEEHIFNRTCPAGQCKDLLTYTIIEDACTGCGLCLKKCPTDAIKGAKKVPHYIIFEKCISCGNCKDVCNFDAVLVN